jgi:hypothetical protein
LLQYGVAMLVGSLSATGSTIGSDSSIHLSEELQEAAWVLPRSMVTSAAVNYTLAFLMLISKCPCAELKKRTYLTDNERPAAFLITKGGDVEQLISTPYVQPYVQIVGNRFKLAAGRISSWFSRSQFYNATQSIPAASALTALVFVLIMFGIINQVTTTSRQLWSFARDGGLPFSAFLSRVQPGMYHERFFQAHHCYKVTWSWWASRLGHSTQQHYGYSGFQHLDHHDHPGIARGVLHDRSDMQFRPLRQLSNLSRMHGMATPLRGAIASISLQSWQEVWHVQQPDVSNLSKQRNILEYKLTFDLSLQGHGLPSRILGLHVLSRRTESRRA